MRFMFLLAVIIAIVLGSQSFPNLASQAYAEVSIGPKLSIEGNYDSLAQAGLTEAELIQNSGNLSIDGIVKEIISGFRTFRSLEIDYSFFNDGSIPRAFAVTYVRESASDGTIVLGKNLVEKITRNNIDTIYIVTLHEIAHLIQKKRRIKATGVLKELSADEIAGQYAYDFFKAKYKGSIQQINISAKSAIDELFNRGDYLSINDRNHHGTPTERISAFLKGYNAACGQPCMKEFPTIESDISGYWELSSGNIIFLRMDSNGTDIKGYYAYLTLQFQQSYTRWHIGDLVLSGVFKNDNLTGSWYSRRNNKVLSDCDRARSPGSGSLHVVSVHGLIIEKIELTLDNQVLQGDHQITEIYPDYDCLEKQKILHPRLVRLGEAGAGSKSAKVALSREDLLKEISRRTNLAAMRSNIQGQWRSTNGSVVSITAKEATITAMFTSVSEADQKRLYQNSTNLFEGRYENEIFHGAVILPEYNVLKRVRGQIDMADDGNSFVLYGFLPRLDAKGEIRLSRIKP